MGSRLQCSTTPSALCQLTAQSPMKSCAGKTIRYIFRPSCPLEPLRSILQPPGELSIVHPQQEGTQEPQTTPRAASPFSGPMWQHGTPQSQTTPRSVFPQPRYESGQAMDPQQNSNPSAPLPASASSSLLSLGAPPISQPLISLFDSSQLSNHYAAFGS